VVCECYGCTYPITHEQDGNNTINQGSTLYQCATLVLVRLDVLRPEILVVCISRAIATPEAAEGCVQWWGEKGRGKSVRYQTMQHSLHLQAQPAVWLSCRKYLIALPRLVRTLYR